MRNISNILYDLAYIQTCLAQDLSGEAKIEINSLIEYLGQSPAIPSEVKVTAANLLSEAHQSISSKDEGWRGTASNNVWQTYVIFSTLKIQPQT